MTSKSDITNKIPSEYGNRNSKTVSRCKVSEFSGPITSI